MAEVQTSDYSEIINYVHGKIINYHDAEDVIQECAIALWRADFKGKSSWKTFSTRVVRNKIADYYRKTGRYLEVFIPTGDIPNVACYGEDNLLADEIMDKCPSNAKEIVLDYIVEGIPIIQIKDKLNISYACAWSRYRRAIKILKGDYNERHFDGSIDDVIDC